MQWESSDGRSELRKRLKELIPEADMGALSKERELLEKYKKQPSPYSVANVCWLLASIAVFYYLDVPIAIMHDWRVNASWRLAAGIFLGTSTTFCLFCVMWVHYYRRLPSELWEKQYPWLFPSTVITFFLGSGCLLRAVWPVWGLYSIPILFTEFMGLIVTIAMIPDVL